MAKADIDQDIEAGVLQSWEQVCDLIEPFPRGDHMLEGQEIQPSAEEGEALWNDNSDDDDDDDDAGDDNGKGGDEMGKTSGASPGSTEVVQMNEPPAKEHVPDSGAAPGSGSVQMTIQEAVKNYQSMLQMAETEGSGIDVGTKAYLAQKLFITQKKVRVLEKTPGEADAMNELARREQKRKEALKLLQAEIKQLEDDKKKTAEKVKKNKKGKKTNKKSEKKADKKEKKNKKHKKKKKKKTAKGTKGDTTSSSASVGGASVSGEKEESSRHLQILSHAMPVDDSAGTKIVTCVAKAAQKRGSCDTASAVLDQEVGKKSDSTGVSGLTLDGKRAIKDNQVPPTPLVVFEQATKEAHKKLLKKWTIDMFGQGHKNGGTVIHQRNRLETLVRLRLQSEAKGHYFPSEAAGRFALWAVRFDHLQKRQLLVKAAIGAKHNAFLVDQMTKMQVHPGAFKSYVIKDMAGMSWPASSTTL